MIRRTFDIPAGVETGLDAPATLPPGQILVTFDPLNDDLVHVAYRPNSWDTWTRPFPQVDAQDDPPPPPGARHYGNEGRSYPMPGAPADPGQDLDDGPALVARHEFTPYRANPGICSICGAVRPAPCYRLAGEVE